MLGRLGRLVDWSLRRHCKVRHLISDAWGCGAFRGGFLGQGHVVKGFEGHVGRGKAERTSGCF